MSGETKNTVQIHVLEFNATDQPIKVRITKASGTYVITGSPAQMVTVCAEALAESVLDLDG